MLSKPANSLAWSRNISEKTVTNLRDNSSRRDHGGEESVIWCKLLIRGRWVNSLRGAIQFMGKDNLLSTTRGLRLQNSFHLAKLTAALKYVFIPLCSPKAGSNSLIGNDQQLTHTLYSIYSNNGHSIFSVCKFFCLVEVFVFRRDQYLAGTEKQVSLWNFSNSDFPKA